MPELRLSKGPPRMSDRGVDLELTKALTAASCGCIRIISEKATVCLRKVDGFRLKFPASQLYVEKAHRNRNKRKKERTCFHVTRPDIWSIQNLLILLLLLLLLLSACIC